MTTDFDLITVTPWRSSGRHRLYVSDHRQSLGFLDQSTGTLVLTDARYRPVVEQALRTAGYRPARSRRDDNEPARSPEPGPRRTRLHAATPGRAEALIPMTDTADPDPEQVWATLAAGRGPRTTSVPHGPRDPSTTLTALILGEPSPDVARHSKVSAEIAALVEADPQWQVLEVDGSEIDHLLIGPGGAFALSTKVHPGATVQVTCQSVVVDDTPHQWVPVGLRASRRAGRTLSQACHQTVAVTTLLVIEADGLTTTLPPPVGVVALDHRDLCRWLRDQPEILTPGTIAMLADTARQSPAWYRRRADGSA
jgi:hypothetical protein